MRYTHGGDIYTYGEMLDFSVNINPLGPSKNVLNAAKEALLQSAAYPDSRCRKLREKSQINSILGDIKGIGEATETILLHEFKSVSNIKQKSIEELAKVIGKKKAQLIHEYFHQETE